jgi:hypothetical protein
VRRHLHEPRDEAIHVDVPSQGSHVQRKPVVHHAVDQESGAYTRSRQSST